MRPRGTCSALKDHLIRRSKFLSRLSLFCRPRLPLPSSGHFLPPFPPPWPLLRPLDDDDLTLPTTIHQQCAPLIPVVNLPWALTIILYNTLLFLYDRLTRASTHLRHLRHLNSEYRTATCILGRMPVEESILSNTSVFPSFFFCFCTLGSRLLSLSPAVQRNAGTTVHVVLAFFFCVFSVGTCTL
jgi:hypothetical protein